MLKAIHAAEDVAAARDKARQVVAKLRELRLTRAAEFVEGGIEETFGYYPFPEEHRRRVRINNPLERILREIRRHTRVEADLAPERGVSGHAALAGVLLCDRKRPPCSAIP